MNVLRNYINESYYSCHYTPCSLPATEVLVSVKRRLSVICYSTDNMRKSGPSELVDVGAVACHIGKGPSAVIVTA